jgi:hypothetical protein
VINTALSMAIKNLTETERFSTSTNFFKSMTYKIVFVSLYLSGSISQYQYPDAYCTCDSHVPRYSNLQSRRTND